MSVNQVSNLTPEACLLILCLNGTTECWRRLNRLADIAELIDSHPALDWHQVMEQAESLGFKRLIFLGLLLPRHLFGTSFPESIWQQMQSDKVANYLAVQVQKQLFSEINKTWKSFGTQTLEATWFGLQTRERWQDKAQSVFSLMCLLGWLNPKAREREVIPLPAQLSFLYYLIQPFSVLIRYKHVLFNSLFKGKLWKSWSKVISIKESTKHCRPITHCCVDLLVYLFREIT